MRKHLRDIIEGESPQLVQTDRVVDMTGISHTGVLRMVDQGKLDRVKVGHTNLYDVRDVEGLTA
jgi:hypothetical protein